MCLLTQSCNIRWHGAQSHGTVSQVGLQRGTEVTRAAQHCVEVTVRDQMTTEAATDHMLCEDYLSGCASDDCGELIHITLRDVCGKTS